MMNFSETISFYIFNFPDSKHTLFVTKCTLINYRIRPHLSRIQKKIILNTNELHRMQLLHFSDLAYKVFVKRLIKASVSLIIIH